MLVYGDDFPNGLPTEMHTVPGDEIVSLESLRACRHFLSSDNHVSSERHFRTSSHNEIFISPVFLNQLKRVLRGNHGHQ